MLLDGVARQLSDSVKRPAPLEPMANDMLVEVSVSKWTTGGKVRAEFASNEFAATTKHKKRKDGTSLILHSPLYFHLCLSYKSSSEHMAGRARVVLENLFVRPRFSTTNSGMRGGNRRNLNPAVSLGFAGFLMSILRRAM